MKNSTNVLVGLVAALLLFSSSAFTVDQTQFVIVQRLGEIVSVKKQPGMHFKLPIVDNLKYFDNRILTLDWEQPAKFITSENKYMMVDSFVKWRIIDPANTTCLLKTVAKRQLKTACLKWLTPDYVLNLVSAPCTM